MIPTTTVSVLPSEEPVSLADAKNHLNVDFDDDDYLIQQMIVSARQQVEEYTNLKLITQTVVEYFDDFPGAGVLKPLFSPVRSVTSIQYTDSNGDLQAWGAANYDVDTIGKPCRIKPVDGATWPITKDKLNSVVITYVVGFGGADDVPAPIRSAILLLIGEMYDYRSDRPTILYNSTNRIARRSLDLLNPYRTFEF